MLFQHSKFLIVIRMCRCTVHMRNAKFTVSMMLNGMPFWNVISDICVNTNKSTVIWIKSAYDVCVCVCLNGKLHSSMTGSVTKMWLVHIIPLDFIEKKTPTHQREIVALLIPTSVYLYFWFKESLDHHLRCLVTYFNFFESIHFRHNFTSSKERNRIDQSAKALRRCFHHFINHFRMYCTNVNMKNTFI